MKRMLFILLVICIPGIVNAQTEVNKVIENRLYQLKLHPYCRLFNPEKASIILLQDNTVEAVNWTGTGTWTYVGNSTRRVLIQYTGEFEDSGILIYLNLKGRSNFLGRIWGTGFYSIGNPSEPSPAPIPCYFTGSVI